MTPAVLSFHLGDGRTGISIRSSTASRLLESGEDGYSVYELELVPWLAFLSHFSNCRIFQNQSVPDIIEKVFSTRGYSDYRLNLQGTYSPREYCVQYRETDFNFISRLMEDEGIFYYFEQSTKTSTRSSSGDDFERVYHLPAYLYGGLQRFYRFHPSPRV